MTIEIKKLHQKFGAEIINFNLSLQIIFFAPNINQNSIYDHYSEDVKVFTTWKDVINELHSKHKTKTNVGIFPSSSLQLDNNLIS